MLGTIKNLVPVHQLVLKGGTALLQVVTRSGEEIQLETPKEVSGVHLAYLCLAHILYWLYRT